MESAVLGEDVEQTVIKDKTRAADEHEAGDFVESGMRHRAPRIVFVYVVPYAFHANGTAFIVLFERNRYDKKILHDI